MTLKDKILLASEPIFMGILSLLTTDAMHSLVPGRYSFAEYNERLIDSLLYTQFQCAVINSVLRDKPDIKKEKILNNLCGLLQPVFEAINDKVIENPEQSVVIKEGIIGIEHQYISEVISTEIDKFIELLD